MATLSFKQMFPEAEVLSQPPQVTGRPTLPNSPLHALTREQLSDIAVAYGLAADRDGTREEILPAILAAEQAGAFNKPPKDPYRLVKASKNADEWQTWRQAGRPLPAFEMPDDEKEQANSIQMLKARAKAVGINSYGMTKLQILDELAKLEGKQPEA